MFIFCSKCKTETDVKVDRNTLTNRQATKDTKALCIECGNPQPITIYAIKSLVTMSQFYEKPKAESAFAFHCDHCEKTESAMITKDKKSALCGSCEKPLNISEYMINAMLASKNGSIDL